MRRRRPTTVDPTIPDTDWIRRVFHVEHLDGWRVERHGVTTFTETWRRRIVLCHQDCQPGVGADYATVDDYLLTRGDQPTGPGADLALTTRCRAAILHEMAHALLRPRNLPAHGPQFCQVFAGLLRRHAPEVYTPDVSWKAVG